MKQRNLVSSVFVNAAVVALLCSASPVAQAQSCPIVGAGSAFSEYVIALRTPVNNQNFWVAFGETVNVKVDGTLNFYTSWDNYMSKSCVYSYYGNPTADISLDGTARPGWGSWNRGTSAISGTIPVSATRTAAIGAIGKSNLFGISPWTYTVTGATIKVNGAPLVPGLVITDYPVPGTVYLDTRKPAEGGGGGGGMVQQ